MKYFIAYNNRRVKILFVTGKHLFLKNGAAMRKRSYDLLKRVTFCMLTIMLAFIVSGFEKAYAAEKFHNPIVGNSATDATQWSYIKFGSYPQGSIVNTEMINKINAVIGDNVGDCYVGNERFRKTDEAYCNNTTNYQDNYYRWEPIIWKVLWIDEENNKMFVVSDVALDCKNFAIKIPGLSGSTWETSTLRSWLNGYNSSCNSYRKDYSYKGENFLTTAFTDAEQKAILSTRLDNKNTQYYSSYPVNDTTDKIFLLSYADIVNADYGFYHYYGINAESRKFGYSHYAVEMGATWKAGGTTDWLLRSTGFNYAYNMYINRDGGIEKSAWKAGIFENDKAIVPAMWISLDSDLYSITNEAGTDKYYRINVAKENCTTATGSGVYKSYDYATVTTSAPSGYSFEGWYENGKLVSKDVTYTFKVSVNRNLTAKWAKNPHEDTVTVSGNEYKIFYGKNDVINKVVFNKFKNTNTKKITINTVKLGGVKVPVDEIAKNAFKGKKKITEVTVGSNVKKIGENAFNGCTALKKVTVGKNVTTIGKSAFYNCKKLKSVTIKTTKLKSSTVGKNAFKNISANAVVKVPAKKLSAYKKLLKSKGIKGKNQKIKKY